MMSSPSSLVQTVWPRYSVDLVADTGAGGHDAEILERLLAPLQEAVALTVALVFMLDIARQCGGGAEFIDDDRVVDDQVDRNQRVDLLRIAAQRHHGVAHGGQVDDGGDAGEILHQHARRTVGNLGFGLALVGEPGNDREDVVLLDGPSVLVAQQVLENHLHREGKRRDAGQAVLLGLNQAVIDIIRALYIEDGTAIEAVE